MLTDILLRNFPDSGLRPGSSLKPFGESGSQYRSSLFKRSAIHDERCYLHRKRNKWINKYRPAAKDGCTNNSGNVANIRYTSDNDESFVNIFEPYWTRRIRELYTDNTSFFPSILDALNELLSEVEKKCHWSQVWKIKIG